MRTQTSSREEAKAQKKLKKAKAELSQKMVIEMVKLLEEKDLLKDGVFCENIGAEVPGVAPWHSLRLKGPNH